MTNYEEDNPINWDEIIKSDKGVIASDRKRKVELLLLRQRIES
jgi:hypothetical protein